MDSIGIKDDTDLQDVLSSATVEEMSMLVHDRTYAGQGRMTLRVVIREALVEVARP